MAKDKGEALPPPADLHGRTLPLVEIVPGQWHRIGKSHRDAIHFSQDPGWRFSHPNMPGTLYLGEDPETCFWEVFWDDLATRPEGERRLDDAKVKERSIWEIRLNRSILVFDTFDAAGMRRVSAHGGTFTGPYSICQQWAKALREHPNEPWGILYPSVRDIGKRCLAVFHEHFDPSDWTVGSRTGLKESSELARLISDHLLPSLSEDGDLDPKASEAPAAEPPRE